jgi:subtilisin-like proprotein convertase family protein
LTQFKNVRTSFNGDLAHLVTLDRNFGGIAYVNTLCNQNLSYAVSDIDPNFENVPTYSFTVYVFTHETGHNLGSPHTHACAWNGNNTAIDSCGPAAGYPYEGACGDAPLPPPNGGTMMSYCHRNAGINFSLGFGEQPRNLIVNRYNAAAFCLSDCGGECVVTTSPPSSPILSASGGVNSFNVFTGSTCSWSATVDAPSLAEIYSPLQSENPVFSAADASKQKSSLDAQAAPEAIFQNSARLDINDRAANTNPPGTSTLYPSTITVGGVSGMLNRARVTIYGLNHTSPDDLDILLVSPTGHRSVLMSDVGGDADIINADITFDDFGAVLPDEGQILSGIYKPTNFSGNPGTEAGNVDIFPSPAPSQTTHVASFGEFYGRIPSGTWRLYVVDDENGSSGSIISGWTLEIMTSGSGGNWIIVSSGSSGTGNGTVAYSFAANTSRLPRVGRIRIGSQIHTVRQAARLFGGKLFDYDGDGKADISVFRPDSGSWFINNSSNNPLTAVQFGAPGDIPAPADYDGDGRTDLAVFRPSNGYWYRFIFGTNIFSAYPFGQNGDIPVPTDFDGDNRADISLFRPSDGTWYRIKSASQIFAAVQFGAPGDKPIIGDFDGDSTADVTVYRPSNGYWYRLNSSNGLFAANQFGVAEDKPVAADYDADGKTDLAVYRPSNGYWYRINSGSDSFTATQFGIAEDKPSPADFDGDGKADLAVFRPSSGYWYLLRSTAGFAAQQFGTNGDVATPNAFVR